MKPKNLIALFFASLMVISLTACEADDHDDLETMYPEAIQEPTDSDMDMTSMKGEMFPAFEGKDLDGNTVKSDEFFSENAVTVINFWFTTCGPCVNELHDLEELYEELKEEGGTLIGINVFTLDGNKADISQAKEVLEKKGATYPNIYFDSNSEAGKFTNNIFAYPTTYVVDRSGTIIGEPIIGSITDEKQEEALEKLIEEVIPDMD